MGSTNQGSGFVVHAKGFVTTNYHVIDGVGRITVTFKNGEDYIVGWYEHLNTNTNISLLRIAPVSGDQPLKALPLLQPPKNGFNFFAFSPLLIDFTFIPSNVSAYRTFYDMQKPDSTVHGGNCVQHTAVIPKGRSGGPLVNRAGQVMATNTIYVSAAGNSNFGALSGDLQLLQNRRTSLLKVSAVSVPNLTPLPSERWYRQPAATELTEAA